MWYLCVMWGELWHVGKCNFLLKIYSHNEFERGLLSVRNLNPTSSSGHLHKYCPRNRPLCGNTQTCANKACSHVCHMALSWKELLSIWFDLIFYYFVIHSSSALVKKGLITQRDREKEGDREEERRGVRLCTIHTLCSCPTPTV